MDVLKLNDMFYKNLICFHNPKLSYIILKKCKHLKGIIVNTEIVLYDGNEWNVDITCEPGLEAVKKIIISYFEQLVNKKFYNNLITDSIKLTISISQNKNYNYKIKKNQIEICGTDKNKLIETVYLFLENEFGCKYLSSDVDYLPLYNNLMLQEKDYEYNPPFEKREIFCGEFTSEYLEFCQKHRINVPIGSKKELYGCHSFNKILKKDVFNEHPEYFALIDGKRQNNGEPCLSNPDVQNYMLEQIRDEVYQNPKLNTIHISQNDDANYCRCQRCIERNQVDGGPIGTILEFVNIVADEFPNKSIITLAYWYSRKAPIITKPRENVVIELCNIEAKPSHGLATSLVNNGSREELVEWSKVTSNIRYWDYNVQYRNLMSPFPNFENLFEDSKFLSKNGVKRIFRQAALITNGDLWQLRSYLLAKSVWDPNLYWKDIVTEFCDLYYGPASKYIKEYIFMQHKQLRVNDQMLDIFDNPATYRSNFLSEDNLKKYFELFEKAKYVTNSPNFSCNAYNHLENENNQKYNERVCEAELPLLYASIYNRYGSKVEQLNNIKRFYTLSKKYKATCLEEREVFTLEEFVLNALENC